MARKIVDPRIIDLEVEDVKPDIEDHLRPDDMMPDMGRDDEFEKLRAQLDTSEGQAESLANELIRLKGNFGAYLILLAIMILGRLTTYVFVEHYGSTAIKLGRALNALYSITSVGLVFKWLSGGWKAIQWLIIAPAVVVLNALLGAVTIFSAGVWDGSPAASGGDPFVAAGVAIVALLFAASHACERGIAALQVFLDHPLDSVKRLKGGA